MVSQGAQSISVSPISQLKPGNRQMDSPYRSVISRERRVIVAERQPSRAETYLENPGRTVATWKRKKRCLEMPPRSVARRLNHGTRQQTLASSQPIMRGLDNAGNHIKVPIWPTRGDQHRRRLDSRPTCALLVVRTKILGPNSVAN